MKVRYLFLLIVISISINLFSQETVRMNAIKANNYGVMYTLPKTSFVITFTIKKLVAERGEFYAYAQRYLGLENVITKDVTEFSIEHIDVQNKGIPNKSESFLVEFKSNSMEPYLFLTKDGIICSINAQPEMEEKIMKSIKNETPTDLPNPRHFFSQETLMAGSSAKQAELVAKQIFALRQSKNDILLGESDNMPPDGEAYKVVMRKINEQEQALTQLFSGKKTMRFFTKTITIVPSEENINRRVITRFSSKFSLVDADNLAGAPIYLSLINQTPIEKPLLSEKEQRRMEKKFSEGVVYNIPSKAQLSVEFNNKIEIDQTVDVVQFGIQEVLTRKMFDNMKKPVSVIFYPELGAIKQIIQ